MRSRSFKGRRTRQGTPAAAMKDQVPESVKNRRLNDVNRLQTEIAKDIKGVQLYEISIEHLCGKQIHEK